MWLRRYGWLLVIKLGNFCAGRVAMEHPLDPLETYAEATGGELISSAGKIESALDRLSDLWLFTYQLDRPPDGKVHRLKIRSRSKEVVVRTARVVSTGTPVEVAGTRALDALLERAPAGDLPVSLRIEAGQDQKGRKKRSGRVEVRAMVSLGYQYVDQHHDLSANWVFFRAAATGAWDIVHGFGLSVTVGFRLGVAWGGASGEPEVELDVG